MSIEDNNTLAEDLEQQGGAIDTGIEGGDGTLQDGQAMPPTDDQALSAFKTGAAEVSEPNAIKLDNPADKDAADVTAAAAAKVAAPAAATVEKTDEEKAAEAKVAGDKALLKEMHGLGIDARSRSGIRFRELSASVKDMEPFKPIREALEKSGIKDQAGAEHMLDAAARGIQWEDAVLSSTATKEQLGGALTVIKCMNSNDPKMLGVAFDEMSKQLADLGRKIGRDVPGLVDPLDAFPDLKQAVEDEEVTRKFALEQAQLRSSAQLEDTNRQASHQQSQQARDFDAGMASINQLSAELQRTDPQFQQKLAIITPQLQAMKGTVHPSQWAAYAATLYAKTYVAPAAPAPAALPKVTAVQPRRTTPVTTLRRDPTNDLDAFKMGVASLTDAG